MNKKILLFSAALGLTYLATTSYKAGPFAFQGNLTGSGAKAATCSGSGCHASGSASNTLEANAAQGIVSIYTDAATTSLLVGGYQPGTKYYVKLNAKNNSALPKFGFQLSCVTSTSKLNAGTLAAIAGSNTAVRTGTINVLEHTTALAATSFQYVTTFEWTAPPAGTGNVTFYVIVNGVNANNSESGDQPSIGMTKTYYEKTTGINESQIKIAQSIYPNPCQNILNIETANNTNFEAGVYDLTGRQVLANTNQSQLDVSTLSSGIYLLRLNNQEGQQVSTFVKQ